VHPNTYRISMEGINGNRVHLLAVSHGGGMVEIISIDDFQVSIGGDYYETILFLSVPESIDNFDSGTGPLNTIEQITASSSEGRNLVQIKMSAPPDQDWLISLRKKHQ
jgi:hypothetical protein